MTGKRLLILVALLTVWGLIFGFHSPWQASVSPPAPRLAATGRHDPAEHADERGFAGAIRADQGHDLPAVDRQAEAAQHQPRAVTGANIHEADRRHR